MTPHVAQNTADSSAQELLCVTWRRRLYVSLWVLIVLTFTQPGRQETSGPLSIDWLAAIKLLSKLIVGGAMFTAILQLRNLRQFHHARRIYFPLLLFGLWGMLSVFWSANFSVSVAQSVCFFVLIAVAVVTSIVIRTEHDLSGMLWHLCFALATVSVILVILRIVLPELGQLERGQAGSGTTGFLHPTVASSTSALGLILIVFCHRCWKWDWTRASLIPVAICHGMVLVMSNTRWATFLTIGVVAIVVIATMTPKIFAQIVFSFCALLMLCLIVDSNLQLGKSITEPVVEFTKRGQSSSQLTSVSGRKEVWKAMWQSAQESPWIGHGFYVTSKKGSIKVWHARGNFTAHNLWLQIWVTTGLIGVVLFVFGLANPLYAMMSREYCRGNLQPLRWLLILAFLWYGAWSLLNVSFVAPFQPESVVCFALLGLAGGLGCHVAPVQGESVS